jgi:hypothetical protein
VTKRRVYIPVTTLESLAFDGDRSPHITGLASPHPFSYAAGEYEWADER